MYCKKCGNSVKQGEVFCTNCGVKLENDQSLSIDDRETHDELVQPLFDSESLSSSLNEKQESDQSLSIDDKETHDELVQSLFGGESLSSSLNEEQESDLGLSIDDRGTHDELVQPLFGGESLSSNLNEEQESDQGLSIDDKGTHDELIQPSFDSESLSSSLNEGQESDQGLSIDDKGTHDELVQPPFDSESLNSDLNHGSNMNDNQSIASINYVYQQKKKSNSNKIVIVLVIIGIVVIGFIALLFIIPFLLRVFFLVSNSTSKDSKELVCESNEGSLTIKYDDSTINGYISTGIDYNLESERERAKEIGIDNYIKEYTKWFSTNNSGTCSYGDQETGNTNGDEEKEKINTITIGDDKYGYIEVPDTWIESKNIDDDMSLQYGYAGMYFVSLNYFENPEYSAKIYASNYMYDKQSSEDVENVTGKTVKIGKNKEYTAYKISMHYPADLVSLITYWFETEDGKVHYITLKGPEKMDVQELTDYLFIPESFSLKNN